MAVRVAVLDANVLYGIEVTDLLLTVATRRLYRPHWSPEILDEVTRNLRLRRDLDPAAIDRRIAQMNRALPGASEAPPPSLIDEMPVNDKDRHVLALAVHTSASLIVTEHLRDFPHRGHLKTTNPIESTFSTVRLRTKVTKGPGSRAAGLAMAFKLLEAAQDRWRAVNGPHLVALVRAGARFDKGVIVEREQQNKEDAA